MSGQRPKPTIKDIARLSEASPSTVSAVLSGTWQARRISETTAERIRLIADEQGYSTNMQARGLRRGRSGLVGLILPVHDNRFFAAMSQSFESEARARRLCPVVVSTLRDPEEERRTVETLIAYAVDSMVIAGATDPAAVGALCRAAGIPHVYVDLPGPDAPSVVSDNHAGAARLTEAILSRMPSGLDPQRARPFLIGGIASDYATARRIEAFRQVATRRCGPLQDDQVIACGYSPNRARAEIAALCERLGGLPAALIVNALTVFEGVLSHFVTLPAEAFDQSAIGCYDYDPFAAFLQFPLHMVRQNSARLIERAFELIEADVQAPRIEMVAPDLIEPRTIFASPYSNLG